MDEVLNQLRELEQKTKALAIRLGIETTRIEIKNLEARTLAPNFWTEELEAKTVMQKIAELTAEVQAVQTLEKGITEQVDLIELALSTQDESLKTDLMAKTADLEKQYNQLTVKLFLNGPYDHGNAIISLHSGQGGTEACDWAEMLYRMYLRYIEKKGWKAEIINEVRGEEAGIKEAVLLVSGKMAYGLLKKEAGTHRLVRQSPFNADALRQTSFALVEVLPEIEDAPEIQVKEEDLDWAFFRAGGHGGQNVNKVNTAVRLKHRPSGLVVEARTERYQEQNRKMALSLLKGKLWQIQEAKREQEKEALKGQKIASWGSQIRSYVLHPYHLVKDVRTQVEDTDTEGVLAGEIDRFIEAEIKL